MGGWDMTMVGVLTVGGVVMVGSGEGRECCGLYAWNAKWARRTM